MPEYRIAIRYFAIAVIAISRTSASCTSVAAPVPISYATTRLTGPLTKDGLVDYAAAFNKRFGKGVTPQNNAAVPLLILFRPQSFQGGSYKMAAGKMVYVPDKQWGHELRSALGISKRDLIGPRYIGFQKFRKKADATAIPGSRLANGQLLRPPQWIHGRFLSRPWTKRENPWAAAWLVANEGYLDVVQTAFNRDHCYVPILIPAGKGSGFLNGVQAINSKLGLAQVSAEALAARAMLDLGQGKINACQATLMSIHRGSALVSQLGTTLSCISSGPMEVWADSADFSLAKSGRMASSQDIAYIGQLLDGPRPVPLWKIVNSTSRWGTLSIFENIARIGRSSISLEEHQIVHLAKPLTYADRQRLIRTINRAYDRQAAALRHRNFATRERAVASNAQFWLGQAHTKPVYSFIAEMMGCSPTKQMMGYPLIVSMRAQIAANRRLDRLTFALAAYLGDHGAFPARLAQLEPKYLPTIPRDPFTGKPFKYTAGPTGCTISSSGEFPPQFLARPQLPQGPPLIVHLSLPPGKFSP